MLCSWHRQVPETCLIKLDQLLDLKMKYNAERGLRKLNPGGRNTGILVLRQTTEADQRWAGVWEGEYVYLPNSDSAPFLCYYQKKDTIITNAHKKNARRQILWFGEGLTQQPAANQTVGEVLYEKGAHTAYKPKSPHFTSTPKGEHRRTSTEKHWQWQSSGDSFHLPLGPPCSFHTLKGNAQYFCCPLGLPGSNAHCLWADMGEESHEMEVVAYAPVLSPKS